MTNSYTGGTGGISRERKSEEEEARHTGDARRHRENTEGANGREVMTCRLIYMG